MQTLSDMCHAIEVVRDRHQRLEPIDIVDRLDRYQMAFPAGSAAELSSLAGGSDRRLELTDHALGQILTRLGIPAHYFHRCPTNLKWAQANHWVQNSQSDKQTLLRLVHGNKVRAALTESYTAFDDVDVVPMVADLLDGEDCKIQADFANEYTHLRIIFPRTTTEVKVGDQVQAGIHISNSEVGSRAVHIDSLVYRLVCSNGMVTSEFASRTAIRHIGNPGRLKDYVHQAIADARDGSQELIRRFRVSVSERLAEPEKLIETHAKAHDLTQEQLKAALESYAAVGDPTLFGAVNAFTEIAKREPSFERRYQVERAGTALLRRVA